MKIDIAGQNDFKGWMDLLELVSDSFPGLVIDDYKIYLANSIERQCAAVCRDHEAVVGAAAFSCNDEEAVEIEFLAVHPECRRMGIAKELISFIIDRFPAGTRFTVVTYREDDAAGAAARKLYKGMGFKTGKLLMMFDYPCQEFEYKKSAGLTSPDFEKLYQENLSNVYKLAFGLAGNANDAEEIAQESFSRAFQAFQRFSRRQFILYLDLPDHPERGSGLSEAAKENASPGADRGFWIFNGRNSGRKRIK